MNKKEVKKLYNGLYKVHWNSGGYSFAAVGRTRTGEVWLAPCNWVVLPDPPFTVWRDVARAEIIRLDTYPREQEKTQGGDD